ncbi:caspase family protein [uncultured Sphaerochaeta sp.]|uniref:caspase family protein n=1 Tax=uncultured Sphaerochaeta sp. TaxID=886478 RepID=UPI002A0A33B3|nr:caspase family protein [uncultured Sphaerochaeta sp.]
MIEKSYLISVGVEEYYNPSFDKVSYAEADAKEIADAFRQLGLLDSQSKTFLGEKAVKGVVLQEISNFANFANIGDRIYIYYAGHGLSYNSQNFITFYDSSKDSPETTCFKINDILSILERSRCKQIVLFLDCCHAGLSMSGVRDAIPIFDTTALIYEHWSDTFLIGFAACGSNEISSHSSTYKHGIWTHHLLEVLNGKASSEVYSNGVVTSSALQAYLVAKTSYDARIMFTPKRLQSPERFGKDNGDFIVVDASCHFRVPESQEMIVKAIEIRSLVEGSISQLPGFIRKSHQVPKNKSQATQKFVFKIGSSLIEDAVRAVAIGAKDSFQYKRSQIPKTEVSEGVGTVACLDFDFQVTIDQSEDDPTEYILEKKANNFKLRDGYTIDAIDGILEKTIDSLFLVLKNPPKIEKIIDAIEKHQTRLLFR